MKAFLWVVLLAIIGVSVYFIYLSMAPDDSRMIGLAFGNPDEEGKTVEIHIELSTLMASEDTSGYSTESGSTDWPAWAAAHYVIKDGAGNQANLRRAIKSNLISERETRGYNDSFLVGRVDIGKDYTFTYIPVAGQPEKFVYPFTAPSSGEGRKRVTFQPL